MLVAPDPTLRSGSKTGKARHSSNIKVMLKEGVGIRLPGEQEKDPALQHCKRGGHPGTVHAGGLGAKASLVRRGSQLAQVD